MNECGVNVEKNTAKRKCIVNSPKDLQPISTGLAKQVVITLVLPMVLKYKYLQYLLSPSILVPMLFDGLVASAFSATAAN